MVNFPTALDNFADPLPNSPTLQEGPLGHSALHKLHNDALEALEARVGIIGSGDAASLTALLALKAALASPSFTGTPTVPTAAIDTVSNQAASTQYVISQGYVKLQEPVASEVSPGSVYTVPDITLYGIIPILLTANLALTFPSLPTSGKTKSFLLVIRQNGTGGWQVTYPGNVRWPSDLAPVMSTGVNRLDVVSFLSINSSYWLGSQGPQNYMAV